MKSRKMPRRYECHCLWCGVAFQSHRKEGKFCCANHGQVYGNRRRQFARILAGVKRV